MSRILIPRDGQWYDELRAVGYFTETQLESWILQHAKSLFPDHYAFPFKKLITSKTSSYTKKPDFALVSHDFSTWIVVEVELERHDLDHVISQVQVFLDGNYNLQEITQYVKRQFWEIHRKRVAPSQLKKLFGSRAPTVLVIADEDQQDWKDELTKYKVDLCIFEIYKNTQGHHLYRVFGTYPLVFAQEAHCRPTKLPNVVEVIGKFHFAKLGKDGLIDVAYDDCLTQWSHFKLSGKQYLRFVGQSNPLSLSPTESYGLFRDKSDRYYFKRS